jgi:hypothetical protein
MDDGCHADDILLVQEDKQKQASARRRVQYLLAAHCSGTDRHQVRSTGQVSRWYSFNVRSPNRLQTHTNTELLLLLLLLQRWILLATDWIWSTK